ncbi:hypothetical protein NQ176_g2272 [Zarea fungicola]|uniref:Uncharacterized protein n=1 Tax=Zarea fungicola TaxID=93591 RepID=A0ACC1NNX1_9HYPO|nr:hypothetical protein NQ176_g2272 [Lecanicillium fungicola]
MNKSSIVLPRPWAQIEHGESEQSIRAPTEAEFVSVFGNKLGKASFIHTKYGNAAFYSLLPSGPAPADRKTPIDRVLFVHGVQTPALGLQPLASAVHTAFPYAHCVLVDLWGHGLSDTPIAPHSAAIFHGLIIELLGVLGWERAHFVGYSFGGSTVATFAARHTARLSSMVLIAPAGLLRASELTELENSYIKGGEGLEEKAQEWVIEFLEGGQLVVPPDWRERAARGEVVAEAIRDWQMKNHQGHLPSVVGVVRDGGVFDRQPEFTAAAKTGIDNFSILGELDPVCSEAALNEIGMTDVAVVPQVGHGLVREKVPEVSTCIAQFWKRVEEGK